MLRSSVMEELHGGALDPSPRAAVTAAETSEVGDLGLVLWFRRGLILGVVAACCLASLLYILLAPTQFTATAQVLIDPRDRQIVTKDVNPDTLASDGGVLQVESQSRVIESDAVLLRAVRELGLAGDPDYGAKTDGALTRVLDVLRGTQEPGGAAAAEERALRELRRRLVIRRADKVFVVDIVVTAATGARAARIADAIAEAYLADQVQSRSESSTRASQALTARLDELKASVQSAADKVERYRADHDLLGTDKQSISDQQLTDNGSQLNLARARLGELQARVDQLDALRRSGADAGAVPEALQSSVITQLRSSLSELTRRQSDMRTRYGDRYPDLIAVDAEIAQARTLISAELDRLVRSAHSDLDRARKNERALSGAQGALKRQTISNDQASVTLSELTRELDARRTIYQAFLARAGETREQSGIDTTNTRIISRAITPNRPSWPPSALLLLGAAVGGFGLGAAAAFLLEYRAPTILSSGQLEAAAGAPVVGTIEAERSRPASRWPWRRRRPGPPQPHAALGLALGRLCGPLAALKLRARPYTLMIASAQAVMAGGLAARLASTAAASDLSVLLVDADPGRAKAGSSKPGFLNVLGGEHSLRSAMVGDGAGRVFRLGIGTPIAGGQDVLLDDRVRQFIRMAERSFDLIVFDAGHFAQDLRAAPLATFVDDVLFVALRGTTPRREVTQAADAVAVSTGRSLSAALLVDRPDRA